MSFSVTDTGTPGFVRQQNSSGVVLFESEFVYNTDAAQGGRFDYVVVGEGICYFTHVFRRRDDSILPDVGIEWKLERQQDLLDPDVYHSQLYSRPLGGTSWTEKTIEGPSSAETLNLGLIGLIGMGYAQAFQLEQAMAIAGTWDIYEEYYKEGDTPPGLTAQVDYEVRFLFLDLQVTPRAFNPFCIEVHQATMTGDFYALPAGWYPEDDISWELALREPGQALPFLGWSDVATVGTATSEGLIASFSRVWEGWKDPDLREDLYEALALVSADGSAEVELGTQITLGDPISTISTNPAGSSVICCKCVPCETGLTGQHKKTVSISLVDTPVGPGMAVSVTNSPMDKENVPASMGYGWHGSGSIRVAELENDDLCYQDETGSYLRWKLESGDYVPLVPGIYVEAVKELSNPDYTYAVIFPNQTRREFDSDGRMLREVDRNGNATTCNYSSGLLESIVDATETRTLYFDYGSRTDGQPVSIRANDPSTGRQVQFAYYSSSDPDHPDRLWKITDPAGEVTTFLYDDLGRLVQILDTRDEAAVTYTYDVLGRVVTEQYYDQRLRTNWYDVDNAMEFWEEDLTGREPMRATQRFFDTHSNVTRLRELVSAGADLENPCDNVIRDWYFEFEDSLNPYLMTRQLNPNGAQTLMEYNAQGNVISVKDAQNNETVYEYAEDIDDPLNPMHRNLVRKIYRPTVTVDGVPVNYDPTEFQYDANGNLEKIIDAAGEELEFSVRPDGLVESITDRRGKVTEFTYYANGNLETVTSPEERTLTFSYDDYDNLEEVTDDLAQTVSSVYDENDRVTQMTDALGQYVTMNYLDGLLESVEAPPNQGSGVNRRTISYTYEDTMPRLAQVDADISSSTQEMRVRYEYTGFSSLHKLVRLMNASEKSTQYLYDALGRPQLAKDPLDRETLMTHAPFCVEHSVTTPRGVERTSSYDNLCSLTQVETNREIQTFSYDQLGRLLAVTTGSKYGQAKAGENATKATQHFRYDELDRLIEVGYPNGETASYEYDEEGNVELVTDPHGKVTAYLYYDDNRLHQVKLQRPEEDDRVFTYLYDEVGRLDEIQYPEETGIVLRFYETVEEEKVRGWDANGQLLFMQYLKDDEHLQSFRYSYDDSGNRTQMVDTPPAPGSPVTWDYSYDWLNRLVGVSRNSVATTAYAYDESDNRIEANLLLLDELHTFEYDVADQLESHSVTEGSDPPAIFETFEHDEDGNMISRTRGGVVTEYRWTDFDQMARRVVDGDYQEGHAYDAGNQRRFRTGKTRYYDSLAELRPTAEVSFFQGHQLLGMEHAGERFYYLTDGLASVRLVVDEDGEVVASFAHDEWGVPESATGSSDLATHTYVGALNVRNENADAGLLLMGHRWYDASLGRFLTPDPSGLGGLNSYSYVGNNPPNYIDRDGFRAAKPSGLWAPVTLAMLATAWEATLATAGEAAVATEVVVGMGCAGAMAYGAAVGLPLAYFAWSIYEGMNSGPAWEGPLQYPAPRPAPPPSPTPRGSRHPATAAAAAIGNRGHYDLQNGFPPQLQARYGNTTFDFAPRFAPRADATVIGGVHPSNSTFYPGSTWPSGVRTGDFKPDTPGGRKTFDRDKKTGKLPPDCHMIPYDPKTGLLR